MFRVMFLMFVLTGSFVFAEDSSLFELRQEAFRLTLIKSLNYLAAFKLKPRTSSAALKHCATVVALRTKLLAAYIAELQAGKEPYLALATARNTVADERLARLPDLRSLVLDVRAFVNEHPEVAPIFKDLRDNFRENGLSRFR